MSYILEILILATIFGMIFCFGVWLEDENNPEKLAYFLLSLIAVLLIFLAILVASQLLKLLSA